MRAADKAPSPQKIEFEFKLHSPLARAPRGRGAAGPRGRRGREAAGLASTSARVVDPSRKQGSPRPRKVEFEFKLHSPLARAPRGRGAAGGGRGAAGPRGSHRPALASWTRAANKAPLAPEKSSSNSNSIRRSHALRGAAGQRGREARIDEPSRPEKSSSNSNSIRRHSWLTRLIALARQCEFEFKLRSQLAKMRPSKPAAEQTRRRANPPPSKPAAEQSSRRAKPSAADDGRLAPPKQSSGRAKPSAADDGRLAPPKQSRPLPTTGG